MANPFDLTGKVALVTGGNGGIGLGMARGLAGAGATIVVAARNAEKSRAAVAELSRLGPAATAVSVDMANEGSIRAMVDETVRRHGRLDILINNAGTTVRKPPQEISHADFMGVIDVNLTGVHLASAAAHAMLKRSGHGKVINIGSMTSIFATAYSAAYAASKGAIVQYTRACAIAWAKDNIQCNAVLPGWIKTDMAESALKQVPGLEERVLTRTPAARWGLPEDFAGIAVFLCSPASDFITGTAIPVDGGYAVQG